MSMRLNVVDGGDRGQTFRLPAAGTVRIGNYGGHTDICLHDLYVAKDHCHVEVDAADVVPGDLLVYRDHLISHVAVHDGGRP